MYPGPVGSIAEAGAPVHQHVSRPQAIGNSALGCGGASIVREPPWIGTAARLWNHATLGSLSIGKAAAYVIANWHRLTRFLNDARTPLDNNATERGIRGPVVGRKNHFGSKSQRGTEVASIFYTLL